MTLTSKRVRRGCALFVLVGLIAIIGGGLALWRIPADAPLPSMYRTEAYLAGLVRAVEAYRIEHGAYPPMGSKGLELAIVPMRSQTDYYAAGPPLDAWNRPFQYVSAADYDRPGSPAQRDGGGYYQPEGIQIFSLGADGRPDDAEDGVEGDDITSWGRDMPWREQYEKLSRAHRAEHGYWGCYALQRASRKVE